MVYHSERGYGIMLKRVVLYHFKRGLCCIIVKGVYGVS